MIFLMPCWAINQPARRGNNHRKHEMNKQRFILATIVFSLLSPSAFAHEYKVGDLEIVHPHMRPTPAGAPVSGGYMTIRNTGDEDDRLVGGSAPFAGKVEVHEMKMDGDIMKMRPIVGGLVIPAGGEVILRPGGLHIMFMQLKEQIEEGKKYEATLQFKKAGTVDVEFSAEMESMDHSSHSMQDGMSGDK
jgi:periplasmic copper chaperone A